MAMYLRYQGEFLSRDGVTWRIEIHQDSGEAYRNRREDGGPPAVQQTCFR